MTTAGDRTNYRCIFPIIDLLYVIGKKSLIFLKVKLGRGSSSAKPSKPLTFEQRDLCPRDLAMLIEGRRRKGAVVTVQLDEPEKILEKHVYRRKAQQQQALNNSSEDSDDLTSSSNKSNRSKKFSRYRDGRSGFNCPMKQKQLLFKRNELAR